MQVALYGRSITQNEIVHLDGLLKTLSANNISVIIYDGFKDFLKQKRGFETDLASYSLYDNISDKAEIIISIGGDGTILDTVSFIRDTQIPILGINFGRMGFLAAIGKENIEEITKALVEKTYVVEERELLEILCDKPLFGKENFGLNEFTLQRKNSSTMININAYINDELVTTYWADGLIVATPTGSTGYSLSCGGPIVYPNSQTFIITPVAPHNLNVRPLVVPNNAVLRFEVSGRGNKFLATVDTRIQNIDSSYNIIVQKAKFTAPLVSLNNKTFINALRTKLLWGLDKRN